MHLMHLASRAIERVELRRPERPQMQRRSVSVQLYLSCHSVDLNYYSLRPIHSCQHFQIAPVSDLPFAVRRCGIRERIENFCLVRRIFWLGINIHKENKINEIKIRERYKNLGGQERYICCVGRLVFSQLHV